MGSTEAGAVLGEEMEVHPDGIYGDIDHEELGYGSVLFTIYMGTSTLFPSEVRNDAAHIVHSMAGYERLRTGSRISGIFLIESAVSCVRRRKEPK